MKNKIPNQRKPVGWSKMKIVVTAALMSVQSWGVGLWTGASLRDSEFFLLLSATGLFVNLAGWTYGRRTWAMSHTFVFFSFFCLLVRLFLFFWTTGRFLQPLRVRRWGPHVYNTTLEALFSVIRWPKMLHDGSGRHNVHPASPTQQVCLAIFEPTRLFKILDLLPYPYPLRFRSRQHDYAGQLPRSRRGYRAASGGWHRLG